jgi:hypothetical protein
MIIRKDFFGRTKLRNSPVGAQLLRYVLGKKPKRPPRDTGRRDIRFLLRSFVPPKKTPFFT